MNFTVSKNEERQTPQCCLLSICHNQKQSIIFQKNNHGLISNKSLQQTTSDNKNIRASQQIQNQGQIQLKRSISSLKIKKRDQLTNQKSFNLKKNKFISSSMDAQVLKINYNNQKKIENHRENDSRIKENGHFKNYFPEYQNSFNFTKDKIQNKKLVLVNRNQFFSPRHLHSKNNLFVPHIKFNTVTNNRQFNDSQMPKKSQIFKYQQQEKKYFQKNQENLRQSEFSDKNSHKLLQFPRQSFDLQQINSYIAQNSKIHSKINNQQQFNSIRTKGKPVQSMLYVSSNLKKTKKKGTFVQKQKNMTNLSNRTVYSEYQSQQRDSIKRQKIQESAVLVNFFHPPNYIKQKLNLSTRNYN